MQIARIGLGRRARREILLAPEHGSTRALSS